MVKNVLHPKPFEMVWSFISQDDKNYNLLRDNFCRFKDIFQYVYSIVYPHIYCSTKRRGSIWGAHFSLSLKRTKTKKAERLGKDPSKFSKEKDKQFRFQQKPIEIDYFNELKEKNLKEKIEKIKQNRCKLTEKSKALKQRKKESNKNLKRDNYGTNLML